MKSLGHRFCLALFCLCFFGAHGLTRASVDVINGEALGNNHFQLKQNDPQLHFSVPENVNYAQQGLLVELEALDAALAKKEYSVELFWAAKTDTLGVSRGFSKQHRVEFTSQSLRFYLPHPQIASQITKLRVDINNCACRFKVLPLQWQSETAELATLVPPAWRNRIRSFSGFDIAPEDWGGQGFVQVGPGQFKHGNWDPRILNKDEINLPFKELAGVYFEFSYDVPHPVHHFELFWQTDRHGISAKRSVHFATDRGGEAWPDQQKLFIPFAPLHSQQRLKRLRFDLMGCGECTLVLHRTRLVGKQEAAKYQDFIPPRIQFVNTEGLPKGLLAHRVISKMAADKGFFIFYALVILLVLGLLVYLLLGLFKGRRQL